MKILRKKYSHFSIKKYSDWEYYLNYLKKTGCISYPCNYFCPYKDQCHHAQDILSTTRPEQHTTKKLANCDDTYYSIDEAATDFKQKFMTALNARDTNIHALNSSPGVGKSTTAINFMEEHPELRILFAPPTNELKNKFCDDAIRRGINAVKSPSLLEYKDRLPTNVWRHIQHLYETGKHHAVMGYITEIVKNGNLEKTRIEILQNHLKDLSAFYNSSCHAFTTHSLLQTLDFWTLKKYDAIIVDEDPILNCMIPNQVEIPIKKLENIIAEIDHDSGLAKKILAAIGAAKSEPLFTLKNIHYEEAYDGISTPIDIPSFCQATKFCCKKTPDKNNISEDSIIFFKPFSLNPRIKYIVLSATVNETIYNYVFGSSRVKFYECKKARYIGTINQYVDKTMSRVYIDKNPDVFEERIAFSGFEDVIGFKKWSKNDYYGKITGIDNYKGKNLTIIGTPHQPEWLYKLFAYTIGWNAPYEIKVARCVTNQ